jgi:hypothetical protein
MRWLALAPLLLLVSAAPPADEKRFMVTGFERVRVDGPFEVEIVPGSPGATASGEGKALDHVAIRVDGSTLIVNTGATGWKLRAAEAPETVKIAISVPILRGLAIRGGAQVGVAEMRGSRIDLGLSGGGSIAVKAVRADDLILNLTGPGTVTLAGAVARARVSSYGDGSVHAEDLLADEAALFGAEHRRSADPSALQCAGQRARHGQDQRAGATHLQGHRPGPVECANR